MFHSPVPVQPLVVVPVEEVYLGAGGHHVGVQPQHLQQCPGAALLHADDDRPGQAALGTALLGPAKQGREISLNKGRIKRMRFSRTAVTNSTFIVRNLTGYF